MTARLDVLQLPPYADGADPRFALVLSGVTGTPESRDRVVEQMERAAVRVGAAGAMVFTEPVIVGPTDDPDDNTAADITQAVQEHMPNL